MHNRVVVVDDVAMKLRIVRLDNGRFGVELRFMGFWGPIEDVHGISEDYESAEEAEEKVRSWREPRRVEVIKEMYE